MVPHDVDIISDQKGLKIIHVNTRSVYDKLDELNVRLRQFDVIVLTEKWLTSATDDSVLQWENFQLVRHDREIIRNKRGGGVCVYIKVPIDFEVINDFNDFMDNNLEFVFVRIKPHMQKPMILIGVYRPPDGKPNESVQHISCILNQLERARSHLLVIGGLNLDYNNKRLVWKLDTLTSKHSLTQVIRHITVLLIKKPLF